MKNTNNNTTSIGDLASRMETSLATLLEVFVANNANGVYAYLKLQKGENLPFHFDKQKLFGALAQMIKRDEVNEIASMLQKVKYNSNPEGSALSMASANGGLWATLGVNPGDFYGVFVKYFLRKKEAFNG